MAVIYIREQGAVVRKRGSRLLVEKDSETLLEIPLRQTDCVAAFGNVQVTTQALSELLDHGIPLALYTRNGRLKGHLVPEMSKNVTLRIAQYRAALDTAGALKIAKAFVAAKLANSAALIAEYRGNYPSAALSETEKSLAEAAVQADQATNHAELLGYEGAGAAAYFTAFATLNRSELPFEGRRKHPATDPINALLSFGYTLVMNELRALAEGHGFEPHLGFLHLADYGRPSLALDLLEPFRAPIVDRLTLRLVNERILTAGDFAKRLSGSLRGSVVLLPDALRHYLEAYEKAMTGPRKQSPAGMRTALQEETAKLARAIRDGEPFGPWRERD